MDTQLHLLDAKREYMSRLAGDIAPFIEQRFKHMYQEAYTEKKSKALLLFQYKLREIPQWNEESIQTLTTTIENHLAIKRNAKNSYLSSLIAMAFVSYLKIMSSCRLNQQKSPPQMRLKLPSNTKFLHRAFVEAARIYYENPQLIRLTQQKQLDTIKGGVETAVRELIPLEDILDVYLQDCVDDNKSVPPILSPVNSDDDEDEEDQPNDSEFPLAFDASKKQEEESASSSSEEEEEISIPMDQQQEQQHINGIPTPYELQQQQQQQQPQQPQPPPPPSPPPPMQQEQPQQQPPPMQQEQPQQQQPPMQQQPQQQQAALQQKHLYTDVSDDDDFH